MVNLEKKQKILSFSDMVYIFVLSCLVFCFIFYLKFAFSILIFPYDIDAGEGELLNQALLLSKGKSIYTDIHSYPFFISSYPPFFPLITSLLVNISGPFLWPGRMLSVIATILIGYFIFKIVKKYTNGLFISLIAGFFFFSSAWVVRWSVLYRVDMLGLLLCFIGIYLAVKYLNHPRKILFSIPFFLLALYTKQSLIAAPLATCLYLLFIGKKKLSFKMGTVLILSGVILFFVLNFLTEGQFRLHVINYKAHIFSLRHLLNYLIFFFKNHLIILPLIVYLLTRIKRPSLLEFYFITSFLVTLTAGKAGSSINYFIEFWAVACILLGLAFKNLKDAINLRGLGNGISALILVICSIQFISYRLTYPGSPSKQDRTTSDRIYISFCQCKGEVLSEYPSFAILSGKQVLFEPASFTQLAKRGIWNQSLIINDIQRKRFSLILLSYGRTRWTNEMLEAIKENYTLVQHLEMYRIWGRTPPVLLFIPKELERTS